jgi:hypothetical protein
VAFFFLMPVGLEMHAETGALLFGFVIIAGQFIPTGTGCNGKKVINENIMAFGGSVIFCKSNP